MPVKNQWGTPSQQIKGLKDDIAIMQAKLAKMTPADRKTYGAIYTEQINKNKLAIKRISGIK